MTSEDESVESKLPEEGTYTLVVGVQKPTTVEVGALGDVRFDVATYAYTGSAFGAGGMKRVERHRRTATGENEARHWHIDYLLGADVSRLVAVYATPEDIECKLAGSIEGDVVDGFGASDCGCSAHLKRADEEAIAEAYEYTSDHTGDGHVVLRFDG